MAFIRDDKQLTYIKNEIKKLPQVIKGNELLDRSDRTLVYGYTCDRDTFHVALLGGVIHVFLYDHNNTMIWHKDEDDLQDNSEYVPNKRVYPERCDSDFVITLLHAGVDVPFTTFDVERQAKMDPKKTIVGQTFNYYR